MPNSSDDRLWEIAAGVSRLAERVEGVAQRVERGSQRDRDRDEAVAALKDRVAALEAARAEASAAVAATAALKDRVTVLEAARAKDAGAAEAGRKAEAKAEKATASRWQHWDRFVTLFFALVGALWAIVQAAVGFFKGD